MTRNVPHFPGQIRSRNAYVAQFERINVAFSRARELLMVFGAAQMFKDYSIKLESLIHPRHYEDQTVYGRIISHLQRLDCFVKSRQVISPSQWSVIRPQRNR